METISIHCLRCGHEFTTVDHCNYPSMLMCPECDEFYKLEAGTLENHVQVTACVPFDRHKESLMTSAIAKHEAKNSR
jgi:transcription elongation factor Elf1